MGLAGGRVSSTCWQSLLVLPCVGSKYVLDNNTAAVLLLCISTEAGWLFAEGLCFPVLWAQEAFACSEHHPKATLACCIGQCSFEPGSILLPSLSSAYQMAIAKTHPLPLLQLGQPLLQSSPWLLLSFLITSGSSLLPVPAWHCLSCSSQLHLSSFALSFLPSFLPLSSLECFPSLSLLLLRTLLWLTQSVSSRQGPVLGPGWLRGARCTDILRSEGFRTLGN